MKFTAACIQLNSQNHMDENIQSACRLIREAAEKGADLIATPENVEFISKNEEDLFASVQPEENHPALTAFCKLAQELEKFLLIGSLSVKLTDQRKIANRSFLINNNGEIIAKYDKIHLFDTSVTGGETHKESDRVVPGDKAVVAETPWGNLGMTICYDVRFPHLYRTLAQNGAGIITVPAAFTKFTGEAHWHVLLRARAIETGCYIIAPAQTGEHPSGRKTFGHSLIIDPWGKILADGGKETGVSMAEIDMEKVTSIRKQMPSLEHDRNFSRHVNNDARSR